MKKLLNQTTAIFIHGDEIHSVICKMVAILSCWPQGVKYMMVNHWAMCYPDWHYGVLAGMALIGNKHISWPHLLIYVNYIYLPQFGHNTNQ